MRDHPEIYNIPAGAPFAKVLAQTLLAGSDNTDDFTRTLILLPTRRACRTLREAFLQLSGGKPLLLPRIQPLGDVDEEDLSLWIGGTVGANPEEPFSVIPPAVSPLRRQLILSRLIMARGDGHHSYEQAMTLADALGRLLDRITIEELDPDRLRDLVPAEYAEHWGITLSFLNLICTAWPDILSEIGMIDSALRRRLLTDALAAHWRTNPPAYPVVAAGSTGSIPSTARLLHIISRLPQGRVILPGLDTQLDPQSWAVIGESHPQYGLKQLLDRLDVTDRAAVKNLETPEPDDMKALTRARDTLAGEIMRPASAPPPWTDPAHRQRIDLKLALRDMHLASAATRREEADIIALAFRETLEHPGRTAALITPDRALARRVVQSCKRWGITVDDSAGQPLSRAPVALFSRLALQTAISRAAPLSVLALLKHPFCRLGLPQPDMESGLDALERTLRGIPPASGFEGLRHKISISREKYCIETALGFLDYFEPIMTRFTDKIKIDEKTSIYTLIDAHMDLLKDLSAPGNEPHDPQIWGGENGMAFARIFLTLKGEEKWIENLDCKDYLSLIETICSKIIIRPSYGAHPRLSILGQLEARLVDADLVIMGGLNEGTWPPDTEHDPWMSRAMRTAFGLPAPEKSIGQTAHDFVQGLCAPRVLMTRAKIIDGAPTIPSRWLQRLDTLLNGMDPAAKATLRDTPLTRWLEALDGPAEENGITPNQRPAPSPPPQYRPQTLPVTAIETLLKDPYAIYARYVLRLKKLDPLEKDIDAAEKGTLLHSVFERFCRSFPAALPPDAAAVLRSIAREEAEKLNAEPGFWSFWENRFDTVIDWYIAQETHWRETMTFQAGETKGAYGFALPGNDQIFTLTCKADRIDRSNDGRYAVIDYKSGGSYTQKSMENGDKPQLPLEAMILQNGTFEGLPPGPVGEIAYWKMNGGNPGGSVTAINDAGKTDLSAVIESTRENLQALILAFSNPQTPYLCLPRPALIPAYNDYAHLARIQEWAALDDGETEAA